MLSIPSWSPETCSWSQRVVNSAQWKGVMDTRLPSLSSTTHTPAWSLFMYQPRVQNRQHVYIQVTVTQCRNQAYRIENTLTYNLQVTSNHVRRIKNTFTYNLKVTSNCAYRIKNMFTYNFKGLATTPTESRTHLHTTYKWLLMLQPYLPAESRICLHTYMSV